MSPDEQLIFNRITSENLDLAVANLKQTQDFSFQGLKKLHDATFFPDPALPEKVRQLMESYYPIRPAVGSWQKVRTGLTPYGYTTYYSPLGQSDYRNAEQAITAARPKNMNTVGFFAKIERLAAVYAELDYLHAFWDGNSRVNRAFVREMAAASGVEIDFNKIKAKDMYIARDKSLAQLNLERRPEQLGQSAKGFTPYKELQETQRELNQLYPNVTLLAAFHQAAKNTIQQAHTRQQKQSDPKPKL